MRSSHLAAATVAALLVTGCAGRIPFARPAERVASATAAGVEVVATTGAWRGWPRELVELVEPVRVRLVNGGGVPLRVDPAIFALVLPEGRRLAAAPVADVRAVVTEPAPASRPVGGLTLGPLRDQSGPGWALNDPAFDPRADSSQQSAQGWSLPSADMVQAALPDGVLAPGATTSGFVYFARPPAGASAVSLTARLVDARDGQTLGVIVVPLGRE